MIASNGARADVRIQAHGDSFLLAPLGPLNMIAVAARGVVSVLTPGHVATSSRTDP
jgi:hypothetical protein